MPQPSNNYRKRKRKSQRNQLLRYLLVLVSITPVGCLCAIFVGLSLSWYFYPTRYVDAEMSELSQDFADEVVIMAAADYANYQDVNRAERILTRLEVANPAQYVSLVAERLIRQNRGPVSNDVKNVVLLADALNVSTSAMIAYVSSPTPTLTPSPLPTDTPTATPVILPTDTPAPTDLPPTELPTPTEPPPTDTPPPPTSTPTPEPVPEVAEAPPPAEPAEADMTAAQANTEAEAEASEVAAPSSEFDFVITKQRLLSKEENGGCAGMHNIFVQVVDANGNPIKGVELGDVWGNPGPTTGHKGDDKPGHAEFDLFKNGFHILVKHDPTAGRPVTSEVSELLSSNDWEVGIPRLIEAGYCPDESTCRVLWNSGVFGEGNNSLCWGHYSWEIVFQRTW